MKTFMIEQDGKELHIEYTCKYDSNRVDNDWPGSTFWIISIKRPATRKFTFRYAQGSAHKGEPDIKDVLYCLVSDYRILNYVDNVRDLMNEFGYTDCLKAGNVFRALQANKRKMDRLFSPEEISFLSDYYQDY